MSLISRFYQVLVHAQTVLSVLRKSEDKGYDVQELMVLLKERNVCVHKMLKYSNKGICDDMPK